MADGLRGSVRRGAIEFVAIFLGVSLSFLAEDYRESLGEADQEIRVLRGIAGDLEQDLDVMREGLRLDSVAILAGTWLANSWDRPDLPPDSIDWAASRAAQWLPYFPIQAEYESAKAAGRIQLVRDDDLRSEIVAFYEEGHARLQALNDLAVSLNLDLAELVREHSQTEFFTDAAPRRSVSQSWNTMSHDRLLRNTFGEAANIRRIRASQTRNYLNAGEALQDTIDQALRELDPSAS